MKKSITYRYHLIFLLLASTASCNFIEIDAPKDKLTSNQLFDVETPATAAILGMYGRLSSTTLPFSNGGTTIFTGLASDELMYTGTTVNEVQFFENNISPENALVANNFWRQVYEIIYHATACIEELEKSGLPTDAKNQLLGESHFIRAFSYWYLVHLFGDVPIAETTDFETNARLSRRSVNEVYEYILLDLLRAKELLNREYPSEGKFRVNYYTALALLSRFYLYTENWQEVENISSEIISSGMYNVEENLNEVFLATSAEAIWQMSSNQAVFNTIEGYRFIPGITPTASPNYVMSASLIDAFEVGDLRFSNWVGQKVIQNTEYNYPYKYKVSFNTVKTEHYIMFRLAEIYLNRAEARIHLNNREGALADINIFRRRADLQERTLANTSDLLQAIHREKRIEYFAEWGHRWFDLKRINQINHVLGTIKSNWEDKDALFPVPSEELITNTNLKQNPGYNN